MALLLSSAPCFVYTVTKQWPFFFRPGCERTRSVLLLDPALPDGSSSLISWLLKRVALPWTETQQSKNSWCA